MKIAITIAAGLTAISSAAYAAKCSDFSSCREAVVAWCNGYHPRADGDGDGIPCENVCRNLAEVERIKKEIGCTR